MSGTITSLKFQQKNRQRVSVYLDGEYAFGLPDMVAAELRIGQVLSQAQIEELREQDNLERAYQRTLNLLAHRARSTAEMRNYLERLAVTPEASEVILDRLTNYGYLDDEQFAESWVRDRERFKPRSPAVLHSELRQKGIAEDTIAQVLSTIDHEASAYRAASGYVRRLKALDERTFRTKLGNFLLRRGFAHSIVWDTVDKLWREQDNESEDEINNWQ